MNVYAITTCPQPLKVSPMGNRLYRVAEDVTVNLFTSRASSASSSSRGS